MKYGKQLPVPYLPVLPFLCFMLVGYHLITLYLLLYSCFHPGIPDNRRTQRYAAPVTYKFYLIKCNAVPFFPPDPVYDNIFILFDLILFSAGCNYSVNLVLLKNSKILNKV